MSEFIQNKFLALLPKEDQTIAFESRTEPNQAIAILPSSPVIDNSNNSRQQAPFNPIETFHSHESRSESISWNFGALYGGEPNQFGSAASTEALFSHNVISTPAASGCRGEAAIRSWFEQIDGSGSQSASAQTREEPPRQPFVSSIGYADAEPIQTNRPLQQQTLVDLQRENAKLIRDLEFEKSYIAKLKAQHQQECDLAADVNAKLRSHLEDRDAECAELRRQLAEEKRSRQATEESRAMKISPDSLEIERTLLGSGVSSDVYSGMLRRGGNVIKVAVKMMKSGGAAMPRDTLQKLRRELSILMRAAMSCTGVTKLYGTCVKSSPDGSEERLCIVMHQYPSSLEAVLRHNARGLTEHVSSRYALQLCRSLVRLHEEGIAHGDLKPANLLLTEADEIIISDFGISTIVTETLRTVDGIGTSCYMSPEAAQGGRVSVQTDMWSFGAVLLEMTTGLPPFSNARLPIQVASAFLNRQEIAVPDNSFKRILKACFDYDPDRRLTARLAVEILTNMHKIECTCCCDTYPPASGITCQGRRLPSCEPQPPHFICFGCFRKYVQTCCGDQTIDAELENSIAVKGSRIGKSKAGALPCPFFKTNACSDGEIAQRCVMSALSFPVEGDDTDVEMVTKAYLTAVGRVAVEAHRKDEAKRQIAIQQANALERARLLVQEALRIGATVPCPRCRSEQQKDDACMHVPCSMPGCVTHFCYVCGADRYSQYPRGRPDLRHRVPCGCDSVSPFLENNPGWSNLRKSGETAGFGALAEFHRRRMARFVRVVKPRIDASVWQTLQRKYPALLKNVFCGRSIEWGEIDLAEHPQFGTGKAREHLVAVENDFIRRFLV